MKDSEDFKDCKECVNSTIVNFCLDISCPIPQIKCLLSEKDCKECLSNGHSKFEGNELYLRLKGDLADD